MWVKHNPECTPTVVGCGCPKMLYGYDNKQIADSDGLSIENDEGWGMIPGPEFGCVHFEERT
jgi:hypothetical protein